jgi:hypothetical protein
MTEDSEMFSPMAISSNMDRKYLEVNERELQIEELKEEISPGPRYTLLNKTAYKEPTLEVDEGETEIEIEAKPLWNKTGLDFGYKFYPETG